MYFGGTIFFLEVMFFSQSLYLKINYNKLDIGNERLMILFCFDLTWFCKQGQCLNLREVCMETVYIVPCGIAWVIKAGLWITLLYMIQGNTQISTYGPAFWPHHDSILGQSPSQPNVSLKQKQDVQQMQSMPLSIVHSIWKSNQHPGVSYSIPHPSADRITLCLRF